LSAILKASNSSLLSVAKIMLYITDFEDFCAFDAVFNQYIKGPKPALSCIKIPAVCPIPDTCVSLEVIAINQT
jgi:enamine deaminase RidA (YjgF/YER057c/UK114 family)